MSKDVWVNFYDLVNDSFVETEFHDGKSVRRIESKSGKCIIDVFGPLPATMGDIPNRPKMTTKI